MMHEEDTGNDWVIRSSVDLAYFIRYGELTKYDHGGEMFEADLMKRRLDCSLSLWNQGGDAQAERWYTTWEERDLRSILPQS